MQTAPHTVTQCHMVSPPIGPSRLPLQTYQAVHISSGARFACKSVLKDKLDTEADRLGMGTEVGLSAVVSAGCCLSARHGMEQCAGAPAYKSSMAGAGSKAPCCQAMLYTLGQACSLTVHQQGYQADGARCAGKRLDASTVLGT